MLFAISDINNAAEDDFADVPADDVESDEEDVAPVSFPVRASVTIEKVRRIHLFEPHNVIPWLVNQPLRRMAKVRLPLTRLHKTVLLSLNPYFITRMESLQLSKVLKLTGNAVVYTLDPNSLNLMKVSKHCLSAT